MAVLAGLAIGAQELFKYNRENFKFDQDQKIERESLRLEMQVKRFELFREDVRDLTELTVDRMDVYHLVGALFLEFCIVMFCEGRIQASAPPFLLAMFLLSNACAFIYLLLAVWLSMHASIASHSFGVRLLTRFVRLPIPSVNQINVLRSQLQDYEKQGVKNVLRLPFLDKQSWTQVEATPTSPGGTKSTVRSKIANIEGSVNRGLKSVVEGVRAVTGKPEEKQLPPTPSLPLSLGVPQSSSREAQPALPRTLSGMSARDAQPALPRTYSGLSSAPLEARSPGSQTGSPARTQSGNLEAGPQPKDELSSAGGCLLAEDATNPIGGDDLLAGDAGALPERHIQLFRQLQTKWQCYDAYCRVCMGLGVNQILQGLSYYSVAHCLVENHSPTTGFALIMIFQCTTVALAVLDLSGLKRREILAIQIIGMLPCFISAWAVTVARDEDGSLEHDHKYNEAPLSFFFQAVWLELWLRVAAPSGTFSSLPRRFRQVLFLDVFGDVSATGGAAESPDTQAVSEAAAANTEFEEQRRVSNMVDMASRQLVLVQNALRRWMAAPDYALSAGQQKELDRMCNGLAISGAAIQKQIDRHHKLSGGSEAAFPVFEANMKSWPRLPAKLKKADPFANTLLGPFVHDGIQEAKTYHFDLENERAIFNDELDKFPGLRLLTLEKATDYFNDLERVERELVECCAARDLKLIQERSKNQEETNVLPGASATNALLVAGRCCTGMLSHFPNLSSLWRARPPQHRGALSPPRIRTASNASSVSLESNDVPGVASERVEPKGVRPRAASDPQDGIELEPMGNSKAYSTSSRNTEDPTLLAMAGKHAQHFVPEKLPWQVLSNITRVLQCCWMYGGVMMALKALGMYQVDYQRPEKNEPRLCATQQLLYEQLEVEWPHGPLFNPVGLSCNSDWLGELFITSPFGVYETKVIGMQGDEFREIDRLNVPASAATICSSSDGTSLHSASASIPRCILVSPVQNSLAFWGIGDTGQSPHMIEVPILGEAWQSVAGAITRCDALVDMAPSERSPGTWCLLLAGWDGSSIPLATLALDDESGLPSSGAMVRPSLDAPIDDQGLEKNVVSLSMDHAGMLSVLFAQGRLEMWNLFTSQHLGSWVLKWDSGKDDFKPAAICSNGTEALFTVGRSAKKGPVLLRTELRFGFADTAGLGVLQGFR